MKSKIYAALSYLTLVVLLTLPLVLRPISGFYGFIKYCGDPLGTIWWIWWYRYAWVRGASSNIVDLLGYPFGVDLNSQPIAPLLNLPVAFANYVIGNEVLTYNIVVLIGIFLTAFCSYLFVRYLTKSDFAGFIAGLIFGFCPNQLMHSAQHLNFTINFWMPLYILFLFKLRGDPSLKYSIASGVLGACMSLTNYYYGYFMMLFAIIFLFFWKAEKREGIGYLLISLSIMLVLVMPFIIYIKVKQYGGGMVYAHPEGDLIKYSARWYDYFIPNEFNPLFGKYVDGLNRHYFERSLYIGYAPLVLAGLGLIKSLKAKKFKSTMLFFAVTAVCFFIFSLGPMFQLWRLKLPNLSWFAYKILPMFRVYARMGFVVVFSVAVMAGLGVKYLLDSTKYRKTKNVFAWLCVTFIILEYVNIPPFHNVDLSKVPEVYRWLADQKGSDVVVEYPYVRSVDEVNSKYLYCQTLHKKKLINGSVEGSIGDAFRQECVYLHRKETAKILAYLGAKWVILHKEYYSLSELKKISKNGLLEELQEYEDTIVFKINAKPGKIVSVFWENIGNWEKWDDGSLWRWMGNNASIFVGNGNIERPQYGVLLSKRVSISFKMLSFAKGRNLNIYLNDELVKTVNIDLVSSAKDAKRVAIEDVFLQPGANVVRFYTSQGEVKIGDVLHNNDARRVCFAISDLKIE